MSIISIYHRVGEGQFREFNGAVDNQLEHVYTYLDATWDDDDSTDPTVFLERVFRQNNSVDGNEINVQKNKRSLSVGDVVGLPDTTYWTVNGLGWEQVDSDDVGFALSNSNNGYEEAGQLCPRCAQVSLMVPTTSNALSRTTRDPDDIPIYVCSPCGRDEAMEDHLLPGGASPRINWPMTVGEDAPRWRAYAVAQEMAEERS